LENGDQPHVIKAVVTDVQALRTTAMPGVIVVKTGEPMP
jgi:hypothetical protein